jgi:hypothetical protein
MLRLRLFLLLAAAAAPVSADPLLITEVVTDPQADHSENTGGNARPYDLFPGTGTVSSVDELVELFNAGTVAVDLTGYTLDFLDTTPSRYEFGLTRGGILLFSAQSSLASLEPGAFALLGNPPGALNNALDLVLRDPAGTVVDRLGVADGNATSGLDEAVARIWTGAFFLDGTHRAPISPLGAGAPVPEPSGLLWVGLSVLAGARASGGRGGPGRRRRRGGAPAPPTGRPAAPRRAAGSPGTPATRGGGA